MEMLSRAGKVTQMDEVGPAETVVYFVEFMPLKNIHLIVAQSFPFFQEKLDLSFEMLTTNLKNN